LQGIPSNTSLYPDNAASTFVAVDKMVLLDRGHTEDLFFFNSQDPTIASTNFGLNFIKDWYGARDLGGAWTNANCTFGVPCMAKHNKEIHVGFGPLSGDSQPKWMGYTTNKQFGSRVASGVLVEHAELKSPDLGNAIYSMDKIIRPEILFTGTGERPHSIDGNWVAGADLSITSRWTEELGTDTWLYGMKVGEPYIYRMKTEKADAEDPAEADGSKTMSQAIAGSFIRSQAIHDTQGKMVRFSSIAPSRKFKNCIWATSNMSKDLRVLLIDVNDFYNINDPEADHYSQPATWSFKTDCGVIGEYALNPGGISGGGGNVEEVPDGDWIVSDLIETFECSTSVVDSDHATAANSKYYHGATGRIESIQLWFQLYKEGGFVNKMFNTVTVEPFLYSTDITDLAYDTMSSSFSLVNETIPFRRCGGITKEWDDNAVRFHRVNEFWTFENPQGPHYNWGHSYSGWDDMRHIDSGNMDADGHTSSIVPMGWNIGFTDDGEGGVVHVKRHSLAWLYGRGGYDASYSAHTIDQMYLENGYTPHQVGVLCYSESQWVTDGGGLSSQSIGGWQGHAWCPSHGSKTIELGIFIMLANSKYTGQGFEEIYTSADDHNWSDGEDSFYASDDKRFRSEALEVTSDKVLYRLGDYYVDLEWEGIKSFVGAYNEKENDDGTTHGSGSSMVFISEGVSSDPTLNTIDNTRIWAINPRQWQGSEERTGEVNKIYQPDPMGVGSTVPYYEIEGIGMATISVDHNWWYPSSIVDEYSNIGEHALSFFCSATTGEHKSLMVFAWQGSSSTENTNFWATVDPDLDAAIDATITDCKYTATHSYISLIEEDATIIFTNGDDSVAAPHGFDDGTIYRYKMSFMYDGYQHSPLTTTTWNNHIVTGTTGVDGLDTISIEVNIPQDLPKRISHLLLWRANDVMDKFNLVAEISLKGGWNYDSDLECFKRFVLDKGQDIVGESYDIRTNLPESIDDMNVKYGLSTTINGYHIVGNCSHPSEKDMEFYILKSELERFDMFNWTAGGRRLKLPNVPTALAAYNGRLFAFDKSNIYTIEPNSFTLLDTFEGVGCAGSEAVIVTEFGMCFADMNNIYLHDGNHPKPIGNSILTANEAGFGLDEFNFSANTKISFDQKRGSFVIFTQQGRGGLYTEGQEYVYQNLPSIFYQGYYHIDGDRNAFSGAYHTIESLRLLPASEAG